MVKGPEQMRCDHMWDACINQPRNRQKGEIAHAYCKQDTGKQQCLSQRPEGYCLSQRPETRQHCLSQRREHCLSQRQNNIASRRGGKENEEKPNCCFHIVGTRDTFELIRIGWTLKKPNAENRDALQLTRNSLDTFHPRDKYVATCVATSQWLPVTTEQTGYT